MQHGDEAFVKGLGADIFVDYTQQPFEDVVNDVDVVFDTVVGGDTFERAFHTFKKRRLSGDGGTVPVASTGMWGKGRTRFL